jgi:hypothetical protein
MQTIKLKEGAHNTEDQVAGMEQAKVDEISLIFKDFEAVESVYKDDIPKGYRAHNTHLFMVEKFTAVGKHNRYKNGLVVHGNEQGAALYADQSSPTVNMQLLIMCLAVAACNEDYVLGKLDVKEHLFRPRWTIFLYVYTMQD